jgi:hypothetical protein
VQKAVAGQAKIVETDAERGINDFDEQVSEPESTLTDYEAVPVVEIATAQPEHRLPRACRASAPRLLADEDEEEDVAPQVVCPQPKPRPPNTAGAGGTGTLLGS